MAKKTNYERLWRRAKRNEKLSRQFAEESFLHIQKHLESKKYKHIDQIVDIINQLRDKYNKLQGDI